MARAAGRNGYALLAVLWICTGITALAALLLGAARAAAASSRNRVALAAAEWDAAACLAHARAVLTEAILQDNQAGTHVTAHAWADAGNVLAAHPAPVAYACRRTARAVGSRLDVNAADAATLARLYGEIGMPTTRADSAALATVSGKPFASLQQLHQVPGLGALPALDSLLDVESGPIALDQAAPQVLLLLPGFTAELVDRVMNARRRGTSITTFVELSQGLSSGARDSLDHGAIHLPAVMTFEPSAWVITASSTVGHPPITVVVEGRLARSGMRPMLVRRRSWVQ